MLSCAIIQSLNQGRAQRKIRCRTPIRQHRRPWPIERQRKVFGKVREGIPPERQILTAAANPGAFGDASGVDLFQLGVRAGGRELVEELRESGAVRRQFAVGVEVGIRQEVEERPRRIPDPIHVDQHILDRAGAEEMELPGHRTELELVVEQHDVHDRTREAALLAPLPGGDANIGEAAPLVP
ncbi:hypothetical protein GCM10027262_63950 [Nocardia tengchongensis]